MNKIDWQAISAWLLVGPWMAIGIMFLFDFKGQLVFWKTLGVFYLLACIVALIGIAKSQMKR